ncbi:MAG: hypothetical protein COA84_07510 [Robiginitomaculum sp.]|nr:MAG: hypothetical protein COA84_07510 [Robiginitomaculum sp.]
MAETANPQTIGTNWMPVSALGDKKCTVTSPKGNSAGEYTVSPSPTVPDAGFEGNFIGEDTAVTRAFPGTYIMYVRTRVGSNKYNIDSGE